MMNLLLGSGSMAQTSKRNRMLGDLALAQCRGIEIGALASPLVRRSESQVLYVDYATTDVLRATLRDPKVQPSDVVDVDIVWGTQLLQEVIGERIDYVIASHVIEHVPDLIGWLLELNALLKLGGTLGLAIPDRRFTFDARRNESAVGEMVEAHLMRYRQPPIRQIFDAAAFSRDVDDGQEWKIGSNAKSIPAETLRRLPDAYHLAKTLIDQPRYIDAHCWVFTPASFLNTAEILTELQFFPFLVSNFFPTEPGSIEFQVRLTATRSENQPAITESIAAARDILLGPTTPQHAALLEESDRGHARVALLEAELAAMKASTCWRATKPVRSILNYFRAHPERS